MRSIMPRPRTDQTDAGLSDKHHHGTTYCFVQGARPPLLLPQPEPSVPRVLRLKHMSDPSVVPEDGTYESYRTAGP